MTKIDRLIARYGRIMATHTETVALIAAGRIPLESGQRQLAKLSRQDDQVRAAIAVETSKPWSTAKGARA